MAEDSIWDSAESLVEHGAEGVVGLAEHEAGSLLGVGSHAVSAVGDAIDGNWEGAAHEAGSMAWDAGNVATGGELDAVSDGWDAANVACGGALGSAEDDFQGTLEAAGNYLGDEAYNLLNPSDDSGSGDAVTE